MKTIGLLGGMSWESTIPYYQTVNRVVRERMGGLHSAKLLLHSVDFHEVEACQSSGRWAEAGDMLAAGARSLARGGAEFLVLCTNTMHKVAGQVEESAGIPLLHIADATAARVTGAGLGRVGLLGTRFTMEEEFYRGRLENQYGLEVVVPAEEARRTVHRVIYEELCCGRVLDESRVEYRRIVGELLAQGVEGVILGCTEIGLLLRAEDVELPLFDTAVIHAEEAARHALGDGELPKEPLKLGHRLLPSSTPVAGAQASRRGLQIEDVPFMTTDWSAVRAREHPGSSGIATWRTVEVGNLRVRMVEYSPGYRADHWCSRGHVLLVLDGELVTELQDGRSMRLTSGMSYEVADEDMPHRSHTHRGAKLFIVD